MLKLFKNPANHIGQKVLYWPDGSTEAPSVCVIKGIIIEKHIRDEELLDRVHRNIELEHQGRNAHGEWTCAETNIVKVQLEGVAGKSCVIYAFPLFIYSNWAEWREAVRYRFQNEVARSGSVMDAFKIFEGVSSTLARALGGGDSVDPEALDQMNAQLCRRFYELQDKISFHRNRTYAQELWTRLERKRIRQEKSKSIRNKWEGNR